MKTTFESRNAWDRLFVDIEYELMTRAGLNRKQRILLRRLGNFALEMGVAMTKRHEAERAEVYF